MKEVYCKDCRYCLNGSEFDLCKAITVKHDYYGNRYYFECLYRNKNCNCIDFKRRWWKFWIKK